MRLEDFPSGDPVRDVSLLLYSRGENAGPFEVVVDHQPIEGDALFGQTVPVSFAGGDHDWTAHWAALTLPADLPQHDERVQPWAFFFRVHHYAPEVYGTALLALDDWAVVSWTGATVEDGVATLSAPNPVDYLRVEGDGSTVQLTVTAQRFGID